MKLRLTNHAHTRLVERDIDLGKVRQVLMYPSSLKIQSDGTIIARKVFEDGRGLEVVHIVHQRYLLILTFYYV